MKRVDEQLKDLVADVIDERIDADGRDELRLLLSASAESRAYYREQIEFHAQLRWLLRLTGSEDAVPVVVNVQRKRFATIGTSAAALIAVVAVALFLPIFGGDDTNGTGAVLSQVSSAVWGVGSPIPKVGESLSATIYTLSEGFARVDVGSGVQVFVEAPCRFEPVSPMLMRIHEGRVNAEVTEEGHGFTFWTTAGEFIDLGTRFGIGVGRDPSGNAVVMSEVFEGEVRMQHRKNGSDTFELLTGGQTRGLAESGDQVEAFDSIDEREIGLDFSKFEATTGIEAYRAEDAYNLALGKVVHSGGHYVGQKGEEFPASNVTDGRVNDTGYPWNWSFWLTRNRQAFSELVIDLGEVVEIDCVQLLNTRNRHHGDRGSRDFRLSVATEPDGFREIGSGSLQRIAEEISADSLPPAETFVFEPIRARYVKVWIASFFEDDGGGSASPNVERGSAGLNEVRVFGSSLPDEMRMEMTRGALSLSGLSDTEPNIALGKPVIGSTSYNRRHYADRVVDGLVDDAAISDLQYSCWLTPDNENGSFVIDLGEVRRLDRVEIQNTSNGEYYDRGTERYRLDFSENGDEFVTASSGVLQRIFKGDSAQFVPISLGGKSVRFLRFVAESHYGRGAGLSELRVFAEPQSEPPVER